jgi:hypothetical protein
MRAVLALLMLSGCAATCPAPVTGERADDFDRAKACVLVAWEAGVGPLEEDARRSLAVARLAEVSAAELERRCHRPATEIAACLATCDAEAHAPWSSSSVPLVVTLSGLPAIERAQGEPWIHELLHVLAYDSGHTRRDVWAQHGADTVQARARSCFVAR